MNRYRITHPNTAAVWVSDMQRAGDYLHAFKNSPDFNEYRIQEPGIGREYRPEYCSVLNAVIVSAV